MTDTRCEVEGCDCPAFMDYDDETSECVDCSHADWLHNAVHESEEEA